MRESPHLPADWAAAIDRAAGAERVAVLGPTDAGKSSFAAALGAARGGPLALIDLDPGQKMVGPPGSVSLGRWREGRFVPDRFRFTGSTSAADIFRIARAAAEFAGEAPFVANTAGFIHGPGVRLQAATVGALKPDLIVAIGDVGSLDRVVEGYETQRLQPSPDARRKSPAARAAARRAAFAEAMAGAVPLDLATPSFDPAPPSPFPAGPERPVVALADEEGEDMVIAVLTAPTQVDAPPPPRPVGLVRLGRMWATPMGAGWELLEALSPSWLHEEPEG